MIQVFSVYDSKTEAFIQPFYSQAIGSAIRSFETAANEEGHDFARHGGDYTLFHLGSFDHGSCKFELLDAPTNLGLAITFVRSDHTRPLGVVSGGE